MEENERKYTFKQFLREVVIVLASAFSGSIAQTAVMIPNGLTSGGMPGIVRLITHFMPFNYSVVYWVCSMLVVLIVFFTMGWQDVRKIISLSIVYPIMIALLDKTGFVMLSHNDKFLASMLVGVLYGAATGIGYIGGYSSGGTDSIARVVKFRLLKHVPVSHILMVIDGSLMIISAFVFDRNVAFYALFSTLISMKATEMVMMGLTNHFVEVNVICAVPDKLTQYILNEMHRGATSFRSVGEYTKADRKVIQTICTTRESLNVKAFLADHDEKAFITVTPLSTVWGLGKGFSNIHDVDNN